MAQDDYTFGDSELAERRLELLGTTFADTTRDFLRAQAPAEPALAVDLGSGPGHTTVLLRDTLHPRLTLAVDFSEAYVAATTERVAGDATVEVIEADALELPERVRDAEVIFVRMLLTHLRDPLGAVDLWLERLAPGGVLLVEEVESIETEEPALARYLALQREMLATNGNELEIGPRLDAELGSHPALRSSEVVTFQPGAGIAARMFGMNFGTWRDRREVVERHETEELDAIAEGLGRVATAPEDSAPIIWGMRQIVLARPA
jgi:SAM-dependent methyltransferase